jgi:aryl-alcohol dehydrogenase-like predicted oxidoreductase
MDYINLGNSGLKVSRICLGCMTYGDPSKWVHNWVLNENEGRPFIKTALENGINFFDTANVYSLGASEEILGRAIRDFARREEVVIATKVYNTMRNEPNGKGLSRKAIMNEIDCSLKRLNMDYVDLYQIHRWDYETPIEETLEALHDVVKAGKARYIGASSMYAWQFCKALYTSDLHGWTRFISMQPHYNLLYREEEREMLALCRAEKIGIIPWSPIARGRLARPSNSESTKRLTLDQFGKTVYDKTEELDKKIIDRVTTLAKDKNVSQAQIAIAWLLHQPGITAPIIGATKMPQLEEAIASHTVKLSLDEIKLLEELYVPHPIAGFS